MLTMSKHVIEGIYVDVGTVLEGRRLYDQFIEQQSFQGQQPTNVWTKQEEYELNQHTTKGHALDISRSSLTIGGTVDEQRYISI